MFSFGILVIHAVPHRHCLIRYLSSVLLSNGGRMPSDTSGKDAARQCQAVSERPRRSDDSESLSSVPDNRGKTRFCNDCEKNFSRPSTLKRHVESVHSTSSPILCNFEECGRTFGRIDSLNRHVVTIHGDAKVTCNNCGDAVRKDGLNSHMKTLSCREIQAASILQRNVV
jgi:uncharacterized Zn-finger protein